MSVAALMPACLLLAIFPLSSGHCICVKDYLCNDQFRIPPNGTSNSSEPLCPEKEICCYPKESEGVYLIPVSPQPLVISGRNGTTNISEALVRMELGKPIDGPSESEQASGATTGMDLLPPTDKPESASESAQASGATSTMDLLTPTDKPTSPTTPVQTSDDKSHHSTSKPHHWHWNKYKRPYGMKGWPKGPEKTNGSEDTSEYSLYPWTCGRGPEAFTSDSDDLAEGSNIPNEFPWTIAILKERKVICSGSLIKPFIVLTAAHCIRSEDAGLPQLMLRGGEGEEGRQERSPSRIVLHPDCNWKTRNNDLALIFLKEPFNVTRSVAPVCFGDHHYDPKHCFFNGWVSEGGSNSNNSEVLKVIPQPIVEKEECLKKLRLTELGEKFQLHKGDFCAGGMPDQQPCSGSGGGALVCRSLWGGSVTQVGLQAWSVGCGTSTPTVYASLTHHRDWLWAQIGHNKAWGRGHHGAPSAHANHHAPDFVRSTPPPK